MNTLALVLAFAAPSSPPLVPATTPPPPAPLAVEQPAPAPVAVVERPDRTNLFKGAAIGGYAGGLVLALGAGIDAISAGQHHFGLVSGPQVDWLPVSLLVGALISVTLGAVMHVLSWRS
jgi:hypothetical protein